MIDRSVSPEPGRRTVRRGRWAGVVSILMLAGLLLFTYGCLP
jgi:hypothetical protein